MCVTTISIGKGRGVLFPQTATKRSRRKALETARTSKLSVHNKRLRGRGRWAEHYAHNENHFRAATGSPFQLRSAPGLYPIYRLDLTRALRPNSPMRLAGRLSLVYTLAFLKQFGANTCPGLQYCSVVYDGFSLSVSRPVTAFEHCGYMSVLR